MDKVVSFVVMGVEMQAVVGQAQTDQEARDKILAAIAQSFHIRAITPVPQKRPSLWSTYEDGFKSLFKPKAKLQT
jgi:hypothetical protein